jgi:hypothetical protein
MREAVKNKFYENNVTATTMVNAIILLMEQLKKMEGEEYIFF